MPNNLTLNRSHFTSTNFIKGVVKTPIALIKDTAKVSEFKSKKMLDYFKKENMLAEENLKTLNTLI